MKLLFDQNLSPGLAGHLADLYSGSTHVSALGLDQASDIDVWEYARSGGYILVSKDSDFSEISLLKGFPPKVIWIRRGNCSTRDIERILRHNYNLVEKLESQTGPPLHRERLPQTRSRNYVVHR